MSLASPDKDNGFLHEIADDASVQAQAQQWLQIEYSQIDAGTFKGQITGRELGPVSIFLESQNKAVHKSGDVPANFCTVSMIDRGHKAGRFMLHSLEHDDSLFLMPGEQRVDLLVPADVSSCYAVMDESELLAGIRTLGAQGWEQGICGLKMYKSNSGRQLLAQLANIALGPNKLDGRRSVSHHELGKMLLDQLALIIHEASLTATVNSKLQRRQRRLEVVCKTRDYILACLDQHYSPTIVDICNNVGVCARVLQYSFNELLQITPVAYLRILRLNKVRQQFILPAQPSVTVTDVATRFGFLHLSKFARDYTNHFGELPSATLQRGLR